MLFLIFFLNVYNYIHQTVFFVRTLQIHEVNMIRFKPKLPKQVSKFMFYE